MYAINTFLITNKNDVKKTNYNNDTTKKVATNLLIHFLAVYRSFYPIYKQMYSYQKNNTEIPTVVISNASVKLNTSVKSHLLKQNTMLLANDLGLKFVNLNYCSEQTFKELLQSFDKYLIFFEVDLQKNNSLLKLHEVSELLSKHPNIIFFTNINMVDEEDFNNVVEEILNIIKTKTIDVVELHPLTNIFIDINPFDRKTIESGLPLKLTILNSDRWII